MKTNQLLGVIGGLLIPVGTFLPFISVMGQGFTLWNFPMISQKPAAIIFCILGLAGLFASVKGGKTMGIIGLICGIAAAALVLVKTEFTFEAFGIGAWLMLIGGILLLAGGAMGMKKTA